MVVSRWRRPPGLPGSIGLLNLTDRHNWIHNGDACTASALIMQELPCRLQGCVKFKF